MLGEKKRYKMVSRKRNVTNQMFVKRRIVRLTFGRVHRYHSRVAGCLTQPPF